MDATVHRSAAPPQFAHRDTTRALLAGRRLAPMLVAAALTAIYVVFAVNLLTG